MVGGIDLSGRVAESSSPDLKEGDPVLVNGFGLGTEHFGGYAQAARVRSEWCVPCKGFSTFDAARIGTAG